MQGNYGSRFLNQWKTGQTLADGQDAGVRNAMNVWAEKLGGFIDAPGVFGAVLASLPDDPPSLPAFVALCRAEMARSRDNQMKIEHRPTPEEKAKADQAADAALSAMRGMTNRDHLAWAKYPRSALAFQAVLGLAQKGDSGFIGILSDLKRGGITDGVKLLKCWDGQGFVQA